MQDLSPNLIAEGVSLIALCTLAIVLRFWSRALLPTRKFQADDWTALVAWPFVVAALALLVTWASDGLGQHSGTPSPIALRVMFSKELIWNAGITLSRISVLLFYKRIFQWSIRWLFWLGIVFNIAWFIMLLFFVIFGCSPVQRKWDRSVPGTCLPELPGQILSSVTSFVLDVYILVLPFVFLSKLQMKTLKKISVGFIMVFGYSVPVLSLGRLAVTVKNKQAMNDDENWGFGLQEFWSMCEISISFIGATIPPILSLIKRAYHHGTNSLFNDRQYPRCERLQEPSSALDTYGSESAMRLRAVGPGHETEASMPSYTVTATVPKERDAEFVERYMQIFPDSGRVYGANQSRGDGRTS